MNRLQKKQFYPSKNRMIMLLVAVLSGIVLTACGKVAEAPERLEKLADFNRPGIRIGVADGYIFGQAVEKALPEATVVPYDTREEVYKALQVGEVDGVADDEPIIRAILRSTDAIQLIEEYLEPSEYAFVFPKDEQGKKHSEEMSAYVQSLKHSGQLQEFDTKWFGNNTGNKFSRDVELSGENGTLVIAYDTSNIPFAYNSAGKPVGYDIDLAIGFCNAYGYGLELREADFTDMLDGVAAGDFDAGCGAITVTEARQKDHYFSAADYVGGISICVWDRGGRTDGTEADSELREHFRQSFVEDGRGVLFVRGVATTLLIALLAALFGTSFGMILFMFSRRAPRLIRGGTRLLVWLIQGIPVIMMVMMLYYIYYRDAYGGGVISAVLGFTIWFGCEVYRIIQNTAMTAQNRGTERDYRLEAIDSDEFFHALWQHSESVIRRAYREKIELLIKATSVVGYIAVQDMTKVFERIRMESYETLLPLCVTTAVYFLVIKLVGKLVTIRVKPSEK
ncbi:MAG: transporter substrate-binding domain-containing protein [Lachnospiraceae bacterium]|nr:transporter substrate-binding domain-containing protein [Lachnospiraceae bacterium]